MGVVYKVADRFTRKEWRTREAVTYVEDDVQLTINVSEREPTAVDVVLVPPPLAVLLGDPSARFETLAQQWEEDTIRLSSVTQIVLHRSYQQIIGMGPVALPYILQRLAQRPQHWFWALQAISGQNPVPCTAAGNMSVAREAWLVWGRSQGYLE